MGVDYNDMGLRDLNTLPTYFATGTNRAIISNRVSYFFDWHGPSMTIDTACSSSLVAVHQAVQTLRSGESRAAVACGTQVILGPEMFIFESNMNMLSPTSRSRMWDAGADGYARGEGVASIVLKRLSDAITDGDHIECLIRETGINQDGRSSGLTVPSTEAQAALIRKTYAKAGLDLTNPRDRPQFFEAHGTGTKAGDPKEAAAIHQCFGGVPGSEPLYVGSIKTVIGHTEGAAGLAGLLKASGIIQNGYIPPNLLFDTLNPTIEQYYGGLNVPTRKLPWPTLPDNVPRRVSVNSFGFGGSNAHAILEEYIPPQDISVEAVAPSSAAEIDLPFTPFVFSATSESSLLSQLQKYSEYLKSHSHVKMSDLAWTLQQHRSQFAVRTAFSATSAEQLRSKIDDRIASVKEQPDSDPAIRSISKVATPYILGIFTGQGAQWAAMGAKLIRSSEYVRQRIEDLAASLNELPVFDRPQWNLLDEIVAGTKSSRMAEAELSQPLCTAIQIVLVDILITAGIKFRAVVGHSSGEIAAAYAAGFLSGRDAIRVAYYRGLYARLAKNPRRDQKGAMLAVGASFQEAQELVNLPEFQGRVVIAAHNSVASVTLSGDADAVTQMKEKLDGEKKFARLLKVDTAYHSHHMLPCGDAYIQALKACGIHVNTDRGDSSCSWYSSVTASNEPMSPSESLGNVYWRNNMAKAVLFVDAVRNAVENNDQLDLVIEVGPHPALKGPTTQNISDARLSSIPYTGLLSRGNNDIEALSDALGFIWAHLGSQGVDLAALQSKLSSRISSQCSSKQQLVVDLPPYQWSHARPHWHESRRSRKLRERSQPFHELLGVQNPESTSRDMYWTNQLKTAEIPWLNGHQLQGQTVFPAAGYVAMALEAGRIAATGRTIKLFEVNDLSFRKAITFEDDANYAVETLVTLTGISTSKAPELQSSGDPGPTITAEFCCYSTSGMDSMQELELTAHGTVKVVTGSQHEDALVSPSAEEFNMAPVDDDEFYSYLMGLGYNYSGAFKGMKSLKRKRNRASALLPVYSYPGTDSSTYLAHPSTLDVAFQAAILAYASPGDGHLWSLHVPTSIRNIRVNPAVCSLLPTSSSFIPASVVLNEAHGFCGSIDIFSEDGQNTMIQVAELTMRAFAPPTEADDHQIFSYTKMGLAAPDGALVIGNSYPPQENIDQAMACERIGFYYINQWTSNLSDAEWASGQDHHLRLRDYANHIIKLVSDNAHPFIKKEWSGDVYADIEPLLARYSDVIDVRILQAVGENIPAAVRGDTTILEHMIADNMLDNFYQDGLGLLEYNGFLANMSAQVTHRYPNAKILEIGAGTGGATKSVLQSIGHTMSSYTYTDISVGFFEKATEIFKAYRDKMTFKTLDIGKSPVDQGFEAHSYDVIIASNVLHATPSLQTTLENTRQLLRPGGYLLLLELTNNGSIRCGNIMCGLSGWWVGAEDGRRYAPTITPSQWHIALRKAGFGGVDTITPEVNALTWPFSIIASQAVDDRVQFLRQPLLPSSSTALYIDSLVIAGTKTLESARIVSDLSEILERFCGQITVLDGLPTEADIKTVNSMSTFVNLVDLESPIFDVMTTANMNGLKLMFDSARHVLWVTVGAEVNNPYHTASMTFSRVIRNEASHVSLNHLDFSELDTNAAKYIAEHLIRQSALDEWSSAEDEQLSNQLLWSRETELFLKHGQLMIPRLITHDDQNARVNSSRRVISKTLSTDISEVSILLPDSDSPSLVENVNTTLTVSNASRVRVQSSILEALNLAMDTFLFLSVGEDEQTKENVVALSMSNSSATIPVVKTPIQLDLTTSANTILLSVANELLASSLLQNISSGSSILVHCSGKDRFLAAAISRQAKTTGIKTTFIRDSSCSEDEIKLDWLSLSTRAPSHMIWSLLAPIRPTHFVDLTSSSSGDATQLGNLIRGALPIACRHIDRSSVAANQAIMPTASENSYLATKLNSTVESIKSSAISRQEDTKDLVISLSQITELPATSQMSRIVDWSAEKSVKVHVSPLDCKDMFSKQKTYILVGLAGQLGQSLCEWMVTNGAGCVCLVSRHPKVDSKWLASVQRGGATIKTIAMDAADKSSMNNALDCIKATCPPIAGVANGAMILNDCVFSEMSIEDMQTTLDPKIKGTRYLDEYFFNDPLEFFVLFSSAASVVGNPGQANYAAACGFLNGAARQRRGRGLAASAFDIGRVAGVGYLVGSGQHVVDQLTRYGLDVISEYELHQMFAETILAGRPSNYEPVVVTTGIRALRRHADMNPALLSNPQFSHLLVEESDAVVENVQQNKKVLLPVKKQLTAAATKEEALDILEECFAAKLRILLQMGEQKPHRDTPLVELGVDSLAAVEVRSWFLKELSIDIPVLKVVGGASLSELSLRAFEKLSTTVLVLPQVAPSVPVPPRARKATPVELLASSDESTPPSALSSYPASTQLSSRSTSPDGTSKAEQKVVSRTQKLKPAPTAAQPLAKRFVKNEKMSFGQSRFWFLRLLIEDPTTFNVALCYQVTGLLRVGDLDRAVRMVAARHEVFRTCFIPDENNGDQAYQKITATSPLRLEHKKVKSVDDVADEYTKLKKHVFDLENGDIIRIVLLSLNATSHYFLINFPHILMDGVSLQVFLADLEKAYIGKSLGPMPRQYTDVSSAQHAAFDRGEMTQELAYWRGIFPAGGQPPILPLLPMARVSSRKPMNSFDVNQVSRRLPQEVASRMKKMARSCQSTSFHFYLAVFKSMLFSFTEAEDLTIGIADANRMDDSVMGSIGFFLNLLTLRFRRQSDQKFKDALVEARKTAYNALENSRLPFDVLLTELSVPRSPCHSPFFQAFFDYRQGTQEKQPFSNCEFELKEAHPGRTAYDLTLDVTDNSVDALIVFRAQKSLYDLTAANLLIETYIHFVDVLSNDMSLCLKDIPLFSNEQLIRGTEIGRGPRMVSDWPATLPLRIDQIAKDNPLKEAVLDGLGNRLTYSGMIQRVEAISEALLGAKTETGSRVAVFQQAAADWVCSMLAIMRVGGIYIPLDLRNPLQRLAAVTRDCKPSVILVDQTTIKDAEKLKVPCASIINVAEVLAAPTTHIPNVSQGSAPAAILYTSGSTGTPKGIQVTHSGLRNEIEGYTKMWGLGAERVLQQSAFTFNHSSDQIYTGLANGGLVYIVPWDKRGDPVEISKILRDHSITYTKATPSEYLLWMEYGGDTLRQAISWRFAFGGGEPLTSIVTSEFARLGLEKLRFFNSYGPTEISISSTKMEVAYRDTEAMSDGRIPCGFSLPNYYMYILDTNLKPLPAGMAGELFIGGAGVSLGYNNNDELTRKHFIIDPFASEADINNGWTRMYRTGDIGHIREDGAMVFHNRMAGDTQIKIRGLRIELADIESNIVTTSDGALREAIVTLREGDPDFLLAHVVFAPQHNVTDKVAFLDSLLSHLPIPQYMIPVAAIPLEKLPLTNHSKVDRKAIQKMPLPQRVTNIQTDDGLMTETMLQLKRIWQGILGNIDKLGVEITPSTSFFLVGGNSLLVIRLQSRIRQVFNTAIHLVQLLEASTLGKMARKIEESSSVSEIDWEVETAPPVVPSFLQDVSELHSDPGRGKNILVTGATGFLAKYVLPQLDASLEVKTIHCVAVRDKPSERTRKLLLSSKVVSHQGDLAAPLLGLSEDVFHQLSSEIDVIIHMGGVRSFWDNYHVLAPSNVYPTRELVKLAAPRHIPIHYISTQGVLPRDEDPVAASARHNLPPVDGTNGYVATRWASERILELSAADLGIPSYIYRFLSSSQSQTPQKELDEFVRFVDLSNTMPDFTGWEGRVDIIPADAAAAWIVEPAIYAPMPSVARTEITSATRYRHLECPVAVNLAELGSHLERERGSNALENMPGYKWIGRIKTLGFGYFFATQDIIVDGGQGDGAKAKFESRR